MKIIEKYTGLMLNFFFNSLIGNSLIILLAILILLTIPPVLSRMECYSKWKDSGYEYRNLFFSLSCQIKIDNKHWVDTTNVVFTVNRKN